MKIQSSRAPSHLSRNSYRDGGNGGGGERGKEEQREKGREKGRKERRKVGVWFTYGLNMFSKLHELET